MSAVMTVLKVHEVSGVSVTGGMLNEHTYH